MEDSYKHISKNYLAVVDEKPMHKYYERPNLLSLLPDNLQNKQVLDLGCGSGWYAEHLLALGAKVTALDSNETMVAHTTKRIQERGKVIQADLNEPLDMLGKNQFDIVIAPLVIHYIKKWPLLFKEIYRVLNKDGLFIFSTHQPQTEAMLFKLDSYYREQVIKTIWDDVGEVSFYHHTLEALLQGLINAGFIIDAFKEPQPTIDIKDTKPSLYEDMAKMPWMIFLRASRAK